MEGFLRLKHFAGFFVGLGRGEVRAAFGTMALSASSVLKIGLQTAVIPVLARLLGPQAFGLVAMAAPLILLASTISDGGMGSALVRTRDSSRALESTVFWLAMGNGFLLAAVLSLLAVPIAHMMSAPRLAPIIIVLSLILPIAGSLSVPNARISRERKFSIFAVVETVASAASALAAIVAAIAGAGPWSLVIQQLVLWGVKLCWLLPASGFRPLPVCRPSLAWPHLHFGLNTVGANLTNFGAKNFPTVMIGGMLGAAAAGHYGMAYQIVRIPELIISGPLYLSMFASVARRSDDRAGALPLTLKGLRGVVGLLAPLFCGLGLAAGPLVRLLLGPAWTATGPILALLAPAGFFICTFNFMGAVLMGLGRSDLQFRLILLNGTLLILGALIGARFGIEEVAAGMSIGASLAMPFYLCVLARQFAVPVKVLVQETVEPLLATLVMAAILLGVRHVLGAEPVLLVLPALVLSGAASFVSALAAFSGARLREDMRWIFGASASPPAEEPLS